MPRLPSSQDITRQIPTASRQIAGYRTGQVEEAKVQLSRARGQFGKTISAVGDFVEDEQNRMDDMRAEDALNKAKMKALELAEGDNGFSTVKGEGVIKKPLRKDYTKRFADSMKEIESGLSQSQINKFRRRAQPLSLNYQKSLMSHIGKETTAYQDTTDTATIDIETQSAAANWADPQALADAKARILYTVNGAADRGGASKQERKRLIGDKLTEFHINVLNAKIEVDPVGAGKYFESVKKEINPDKWDDMSKLIEKAENERVSELVFNEFNDAKLAGKGDEYLKEFMKNPPDYLTSIEVNKFSTIMDKSISKDIRVNKRLKADELSEIVRSRAKKASDLKIAVSRGDVGEDDIESSYQDNVISAGERTTLIKELDIQTKSAVKLSQQLSTVTAAITTGIPMSSGNKNHVKAVDSYWADMSQDLDPFSDEGMNKTADLVATTTILPTQVKNLVQAYGKSGNTEQAVQSAELLARINEKSPQALSNVPKEAKAFGLLVSRQVDAGMDPKRAVELSRLSVYETTPEEHQAFKDAFEMDTPSFRKTGRDYLNGKIDDDFDEWFSTQPTLPAAMEGEFHLLTSQYLGMTKDIEQAQELAYADLKRVWGVTEINGGREMMKYPPELLHGEGDWIREQLMIDVKSIGAEGDPVIAIDPSTAREEMPTYLVMIRDESGMLNPVLDENNMPMRWMPDFTTSKEGKKQQKELKSIIKTAKEERAKQTEILPEPMPQMRTPSGLLRDVEDVR